MITEFKMWLGEPFQTDMDLFHWVLFVLLLMLILGFWTMTLRHLAVAVNG
jgi:hypothetical protein